MKTYVLHQREIRVVPVTIQAESLEEAKEIAMEGGGDYSNDASTPSDLSFTDLCDNLFEEGYEDGKEIEFERLNSLD